MDMVVLEKTHMKFAYESQIKKLKRKLQCRVGYSSDVVPLDPGI